MSDKVVGIEINIGGNTTGLDSALSKTNKEINSIQKELSQVEKLLKLDPTNTELLAQKEQLLSKAVEETKTKVNALKDAKSTADKQMQNGTEINQEQYRKLQREIASSEQSIKRLDEESKKTNNTIAKIKEAFSGLGEASAQVLKSVGTGVATITASGIAGAVAIGKASVESYAEYEQLIGGVETLFKDSSDIVENYANNAYKTAGLSANEYMETVTSFSASLLQSLNNDTEETAKVADMAITDMADNANKMGTSMSSIQSAYQGFAKQNYTMLDNLKLGYGGTKSEMERLLSDAEKLSGQKYNISNLNDVYSAIHVVQTELGITGTTAKEASQTISGSVSAMKSAWSNLLTGMSDENADLEMLIENLVESILTALDNVLPRIEVFANQIPTIMSSILTKVSEHLPQLLITGACIIQNLIAGISQNMPQIINVIMQVMMMLVQTIISMLPQIIQMGMTIIIELINGIAQQMPALIPAIVECVLLIVQTLLDNLNQLIEAGIQILLALIQGIIESLPMIIEQLPVIITKIIEVITNNLPLIIEAGITILLMLIEGIIKSIPDLIKAIPQIITAIVDGIKSGIANIKEVGKNLVQGLWNGIINLKDWLYNKVIDFANGILSTICSALGIESPSKVFRDKVGKNIAFGVGVGFTSAMNDVADEMSKTMTELTDSISSEISIGDIPKPTKRISQENNYITRNYNNSTEVVREATPLTLELDGKTLGRLIVPLYDKEKMRMGVSMA